ncbi:uncharacterized protein [Cardiocondyla obscurior]|uniref:uncharacterized protein n=1 Tax=Cardiocondyla obscurior TaxID=286306 RepID=UPI0039657235
MREMDNTVVHFSIIYDPKRYDFCVNSVNKLAQFDETTWTYKIPSIASSLGTLIKQVGQILRSMCIKKEEFDNQVVVENFLKIFEENYPTSVNKVVRKTLGHRMRQRKVVLPSMNDIKKLSAYLTNKRTKALHDLQKDGFSIQAWRTLSETTLVSTMMFNRRRPGELERILIENLKTLTTISKEEAPELYKSFSKYVQIMIRGKLARTVPVLLHKEILHCMEMIVNYRTQAGVSKDNPFIFGINTMVEKRSAYLKACVLIRKYSKACGADIPSSLRCTTLRKHIATICITLDVSDTQINDLADFMGHHEKIHKSHYRQSILTQDLAISQLLKYAQGDNSDKSESEDTDEDEDEDENDNNDINDEKNQTNKNVDNSGNKHCSDISTYSASAQSTKSIDKEIVNSDRECNKNLSFNVSNTARKRKQSKKTFIKNDVNAKIKKKKISPFGSTRRTTNKTKWTIDERTTVLSFFYTNIQNKKLPSFHEINELKQQHSVLKNRTNAQIKVWIHNQIKKVT